MPSAPFTFPPGHKSKTDSKEPETDPQPIPRLPDTVHKKQHQTKSQTKPNVSSFLATKPDTETKSNEMKTNESKGNESKGNESKGNESKGNELKTNDANVELKDEETCWSMLEEVLGKKSDFNEPIDGTESEEKKSSNVESHNTDKKQNK